jgi:ankyrin repeat protein
MDLESEEDIIYVLDITKAFNNDMLPTNRTYKHDISRFYTLHHGIESGDLEEEDLFKLLEDNEDSANKTDAKGNYPIAYACNNVKYKKFAMELTTRYPDAVKNQDWTNRSNPLHVAVQWRRKQVISLIRLNANCLINYLDNENNGVTPLQQLCKVNNWSNENDKVLTMLLKFPNLLINKKSPENGYTALHYACMKYNWPAINLLLGHNKINIYNVDNERNPPFLKLIEDDDDSVTYQQILSIEAFLKNKTIAILQVGAKTRNALHLACIYGSPMMFGKIFLLKRSDINLGDVNGDTPLHLACAYNNKCIVNDLIKEPDIMIDNQNVHGQTPFHVACLNGSIECITMLLSMNEIKSYELLNEHTVDHNGSTVLHDVVCTGNYDVRLGTLKLLLGKYSMFANKKIKNNNGFTPLELAIIESLKAKARDSEHGIKVFEEIINLLK